VCTVKIQIYPTFLVYVHSISGLFGLACGILAQLHLAKTQTMTSPNSPDMLCMGY